MVIFFEEQDLVSFGNFILERVADEFEHGDLRGKIETGISGADIENWAYRRSQEQIKEQNTKHAG